MSYINNFYNINMLPDEEMKRRLKTPLSDDDIDKYFDGHKTEIMKYHELENYNSIDELLPKPFDYKIILIETKHNRGHWVLLMKRDNTIEYFNSYGVNADIQKNSLNKMMNKMLGQKEDFVSRLIRKSKKKYVINNIPFQNKNPEIATCGRWCIIRILTAEKTGMDLTDFTKYILTNCDKMRISPDMVVCMFIN